MLLVIARVGARIGIRGLTAGVSIWLAGLLAVVVTVAARGLLFRILGNRHLNGATARGIGHGSGGDGHRAGLHALDHAMLVNRRTKSTARSCLQRNRE